MIGVMLILSTCWGHEPKAPPRIVTTAPLAVSRGTPVTLALRGLRLDEATGVTIAGTTIPVQFRGGGKSAVPANYDAAKVGDTQLEVTLTLPVESPDSIALVVQTPTGDSAPHAVVVHPAESLVSEKEPNDSLDSPQRIPVGAILTGTIHEARNVDVIAVELAAGQKVRVHVEAAGRGSLLDPLVTVFDSRGQVVVSRDDGVNRDPQVEFVASAAGDYRICLQDANDSGGIHFAYLLQVLR